MKDRFILFDFDGVIADSFEAAFETIKTICPAITEMDYRKRFKRNINEVKVGETFHNDECRHELNWFDIYIPLTKSKTTVFDGMKELVYILEKEYTLIIISSTITSPIEEFLISHNLHEHFDWVMGNDVHKSKVEKIKMVFDRYKTTSSACVFITDTLGDMHEAEKMNVRSIGVTWGFCQPEVLKAGNPYRLVTTPNELHVAITDYFSDTFV